MKKQLLLSLAMLGCGASVFAQDFQEVPGLNAQQTRFYYHLKSADAARREAIREYLAVHPETKEKYRDAQGQNLYIHHIGKDGRPVYYATRSNLGLAQSVKTSKVWTGGGLGLSLMGQGLEVSATRARLGVWEPGPARTAHQEFGSRATTRDMPLFSTSDGETEHATHVAATMAATGIQPTAHGMANGAKLDCYETKTDETAEMLQAGAQGMLVSNHSYGPSFSAGNSQPNGYYDEDCKTYDSIIISNKTYLPVMAAGNDRDESQNIKWDILVGGANAKNLLAVAAVKILGSAGYTGPGSVEISDFSSYGPTDDGRIKPDISAPGVQIYSATSTSNTDYKAEDGTSMASPGVAGSLFLLQQQYNSMKGAWMRASTLRGLALHTADEAGAADGPDYAYGWGLLNMEKAINVLRNDGSSHFMAEATLNNGTPYRRAITTAGGAFKATICWTDPTGTPVAGAPTNNRTPMLVNDLDLRIIDAATNNSIATLPWKLDPANPSAAATRGDNVVDNVEQIWVANLPAGSYFIQVGNKGSLQGGSQEFAVFASGVAASASSVYSPGLSAGGIIVSPVPASAYVTIANTATALNGTQAIVLNIEGREVTRFLVQPKQTLDMRLWAPGIYSLRMADGTVSRIVKQ